MSRKLTFYLCPGIRTHEDRLESLGLYFSTVAKQYFMGSVDFKVELFDYGFIGPVASILPFTRRILQRSLGKELLWESEKYPDRELIVLSYSFSSHLTSELFLNPKYKNIKVKYWAMFGGVVRTRFHFTEMKAKINKVYNFCSLEDDLAKYMPPFFNYGRSGAYGFRANNGAYRAHNKGDGEQVVWTKETGDPWVTNVYRNSVGVDHSGPRGWFNTSMYVRQLFDLTNGFA